MNVGAYLQYVVTANTAPADAALARSQARLKATASTSTATASTMKKAFLGIGLAAGGAAVALYKIGEAFDDASDTIRTKTGATGKELAKLNTSFKNVVRDVPADFDSASKAIAGLNQRLDLSGKPLERLSKQILNLSRITGTDVDANVQSLTRLFGDWSISTDKQAKTLDKLYRASEETGVQIGDLSNLMVQFGSPLRQLGLDFDTAAAMFSRFEKEGVNIQTLMPGLRMALKNFSAPTDELAKTFDKLNISLKDPSQALADVFAQLKSAPSDLKANALAFEVFGARAGPDMAAAVREGRFELDKLMGTIKDGNDTINKASRQTMDFSEQWQLFKNNAMVALEPVAKRVFSALSDAMKDVTDVISDKNLDWSEKWDKLMDMAMDAFSDLVSRAGSLAPKVAKAFVEGFVNAPILGQLVLSGWLLGKLGGLGAVGGIGTRIGTRLGMSMGGAAGPIVAAGIIAAIEGAKVGHKVADSMTTEISDVDLFKNALEDGGKTLRDMVRYAHEHEMAFDKGVIQEWVKAGTITTREGGKMIAALKDVNQQAAEVARRAAERQGFGFARALAADGKLLKPELKKIIDQLATLDPKARNIASASMANMAKVMEREGKLPEGTAKKLSKAIEGEFGEIPKDAADAGADTLNSVDKYLKKAADVGTSHAKRLKEGVVENVTGLTHSVVKGFDFMIGSTNKALHAFGVDEIKWQNNTTQPQARQQGGIIHAARGRMVPGRGNGDKVPAMLEPGEVVLNKRAVAQMGGARKANRINRLIPRFADGGVVYPHRNYPMLSGDTDMNPALGTRLSQMAKAANTAISVTSGGRTYAEQVALQGGPNPAAAPGSSHHEFVNGAIAADISPGYERFGGMAGKYGMMFNLLGIGEPWHIELANAASAASGAVAQVVKDIKRIMLEGPDGPLKNMGQAALDKVRDAANSYLSKQAPSTPAGGVPSGGSFTAGPGTLSKPEMRSLMGKVGLPDIFGYIAEAESGLNPNAYNPSGASGLWQIMMPLHSALVQQAGGDVFDPLTNAKVASALSGGGGNLAPWVESQSVWGSHVGQAYQTGGIVGKMANIASAGQGMQHFASGGIVGKGGKSKPGGGLSNLPDMTFHPGSSGSLWTNTLNPTKPPKAGGKPPTYQIAPPSIAMQIAALNVAAADAESTLSIADDRAVLDQRALLVKSQISKVANLLAKKNLSPKRRLALMEKLATLKGDLNSIASSQQGLYDSPDFTGGDQTPTDTSAADQAAAQQALADELKALRASIDQQNALISAAGVSDSAQALAAVGALLTGEIGGQIAPRFSTAGSGSVWRA